MPALPFPDGETLYGPAPRPVPIDFPEVHYLDDSDPYAATQCYDEIRNGDVLVIRNGYPDRVVGVLIEAWPVALHGDGEPHGFHTIADDTDPATIGAERYGRTFMAWICPKDAPRFQSEQRFPVRGGYDMRASFALAARIAAT